MLKVVFHSEVVMLISAYIIKEVFSVDLTFFEN